MKLREQIVKAHTKANKDIIVKWVGHSQERFDQLLDLFLHDEYRVVQRAGWPLSYIAIEHPQLVKKHIGKVIKNLQRPNLHNAIKRNTVRFLQFVEIPKRYHGELMDICFSYISSATEAVAVKAFSLSILERLCRLYPEIRNELKLVINERWDHETAAFRSRARKIREKIE